jgi:two-component system OmpR family sensor kinase
VSWADRSRSLYHRLAVGFAVITIVGVAIADFGSIWALGDQLRQRADASVMLGLHIRLKDVNTAGTFPAAEGPCAAALFESDGGSLKQTAGDSVRGARLELSLDQLRRYARYGRPVTVEPGPWRLAVARLPDGRFVAAAQSTASDERTLRTLLAIELIISVPLVAAVVCGTVLFCRRALAPVNAVTHTALRIMKEEQDLSHRVRPGYSSRETTCMADAFNAMLDRIESEFTRRQKAEGELRDFVAAASHELRTPLTTIAGYAQLARLGALDDPLELDTAMERVQKEAHRLSELVDELLLLARLDQGRPLERVPVNLAQVCAEVIADGRVIHPERELRYRRQSGGHVVLGDPSRLRQAVINLVCNACTHTPPGTYVEIRLSREDGWEVLDVLDQGPGIPEELRERVFERFFQVTRKPHQQQLGGSGLGLSIVSAVLSAHGGSVAIEPSDRGAWFRARIPAAEERAPGSLADS